MQTQATVVGVDWGTTNRRAYALDDSGRVTGEAADDQGMLAARGRFEAALGELLAQLPALSPAAPVLMSGMVGSAQGWREVPYLDTAVALDELPRHLVEVPAPSLQRRCWIVPGYRHRSDAGVDVMRGEETQLYGALALGAGDGWIVLPGTHSKWAELRDGRIAQFATYMTGELYALLGEHGTLSSMLAAPQQRDPARQAAAFADGVDAATRRSLSNALFGCRARVVAGAAPAADSASYLSGVLIGAEWADVRRRNGGALPPRVAALGSPALAQRHADAGALFGCAVQVLEARDAHLAALQRMRSML